MIGRPPRLEWNAVGEPERLHGRSAGEPVRPREQVGRCVLGLPVRYGKFWQAALEDGWHVSVEAAHHTGCKCALRLHRAIRIHLRACDAEMAAPACPGFGYASDR